MDFINYLRNKKIDPDAFREADPDRWGEWKHIFDQVHPDSFTAQKLFLINPFRHIYPLKDPETAGAVSNPANVEREMEPSEKDQGKKKPVVKPKLQVNKEAGGAKPKPKIKPKIGMKPKIKKPTEGEGKSVKLAEKPSEPESKDNKTPDQSNKKPRPVIKRPKKD